VHRWLFQSFAYLTFYSQDLIVSWGVDGRLCLWDSHSHGQIHAPISTLISRQDYPIYAVDVSHSVLAVGGGRDAGFLGVPLYLYNVNSTDDEDCGNDDSGEPTETKK
jgi:WD40 repeat protein